MAQFEALCSERNALATDRDDMSDEDLWEEKELTFSPFSSSDPKGFVCHSLFA